MNFSICLIARNESKTLPRLIESLSEFRARGGEILLLDTGSTDNTAQIARDLGCIVHEVGDKFRVTFNKELTDKINEKFVVDGEDKVIKEGESMFDYASARNYIADFASNDVVATPDCDEIYTKLDLDKISKMIDEGVDQFEYNFVFAHDHLGNELVKFIHSKFYNRKKLKWVGIIHEVLQGEATRKFVDESVIKLEHYQNVETNRSHYLRGLAYDCYLNPDNDRNAHYFGRELMYKGQYKSAIGQLKRHVSMNKWPTEASQSMVFIGQCYESLGQIDEALGWYVKAYDKEPNRREPLMKLAEYYYRKGSVQHVITYVTAALEIQGTNYYANYQPYYDAYPHELLYWAYWQVNNRVKSKEHFDKAFAYQPLNEKYLHDYQFYYTVPSPKVSIIIPTLGREDKLQRLLSEIPCQAGYENYEIIVERDNFENRQGVPKTLKKGVEKSTGDLVMYLGNDCIPQKDFLKLAVQRMYRSFGDAMDGLVGLNDGYWKTGLATHWLASKKLLPYLDGEFFHTGYHHLACDNELTGRCEKIGKYVWAPEAKIDHDHPIKGGFKEKDMDEVYKIAYNQKNMEEDRALLKQRAQLLGFNTNY